MDAPADGAGAFGEQAWEHARKVLARRGQDPVTEGEIARAAAALLDGPSRDRRKARKNGGTGEQPPGPGRIGRRPSVPEEERRSPQGPPARVTARCDGPLADVIPLGIFDAREEAKKWW